MIRSDTQRLDDIRDMCVRAADIVGRGRQALNDDDALWLALERAVEIVGEAATNLSPGTMSQFPKVDWQVIVDSRVVYAHKYHRIDRDLLWNTAEQDLPVLLESLGPAS